MVENDGSSSSTSCAKKIFQPKIPILTQLMALPRNIIQSINLYPIHLEKKRKKLMKSLCSSSWWSEQPLLDVFNYLGPKIAMYFGWLAYYITFLIRPSILGIMLNVYSSLSFGQLECELMVCYIFFLVTVTAFLVGRWKQRQVELEYHWKYHPVDDVDEKKNPSFHGEWIIDKLTKKGVFDYPTWKRTLIRLFVSFPIMIAISLLVLSYVLSLSYLVDFLITASPQCKKSSGFYLWFTILDTTRTSSSTIEQDEAKVTFYYCQLISHGPGVLNVLAIAILNSNSVPVRYDKNA
jgi:hypothetical protein